MIFKVLLLSLMIPAAASAAGGGNSELTGLMDRVIASPSDPVAKDSLDLAAGRAVAAERRAVDEERQRLLQEAAAARKRRVRMESEKESRTAAWRRSFERACDLASDADTVRDAVEAYEGLLESFPVFSDSRPLLEESSGRIMAIFLRTIRKTAPYLAEGREKADARMLASLVFSKSAVQSSAYGGMQASGMAESQLRKAEKLLRLEAALKRQLANFSEGLSAYRRRRWDDSVRYLGEVTDFDSGNVEAVYYRGLAKARLAEEK